MAGGPRRTIAAQGTRRRAPTCSTRPPYRRRRARQLLAAVDSRNVLAARVPTAGRGAGVRRVSVGAR